MSLPVYPEPKKVYRDKKNPARQLVVRHVIAGDPLGREIRGDLLKPGQPTQNYVTDLATFAKVWTRA